MTENAVEARVWIDDILLQDLGVTVLLNSQEPALPAMRNFNTTIPGKHGALDLGAYLEPRQFELNCVFARQSYTELKRSILELNTLLVDENGHPKTVKLRFGDDEHKWFIVRLTDGIPIERVAERGFYTLILTAFDPFAYAPATYYDPDRVGDYAESVHKWEFRGEKRGVNLYRPSLVTNLIPTSSGTTMSYSTGKSFHYKVKSGELYSFSRNEATNDRFRVVFYEDEPAQGTPYVNVDSHDKKLKVEGVEVPEGINYILLYLVYQEGKPPSQIKIEKGDKSTPFSPALEDSLIRNPTFNGQVSGRNIIPNTSDSFKTATWTSWNYYPSPTISSVIPGEMLTASVYYRNIELIPLTLRFIFYKQDGSYIESTNGSIVEVGEEGCSVLTYKVPEDVVTVGISLRRAQRYDGTTNAQYKEFKLEKGDKATPYSPAPEDSGWQFSQTIEGDFYGDGETNDKLVWINSMPYKESWWYFAGERLLKRDKPEIIKVRSRGAVYLKEGINTINVSDENNLLDNVDMTYQHGTVKLSRGDNIIDSPQLEYSEYGADLEYTNQVYSPFQNTRQYVGVFNYSHYATPFNFVIEGYCKNPKIINQTTGRYISFNLTVQNDERLYIDSRRLTTWKIKIKDDQYEYLTPHKIMRDYEAWDRINAYNESEGDFVMLSSGDNHWRFESDDTPDAKIYLDWEHRFL